MLPTVVKSVFVETISSVWVTLRVSFDYQPMVTGRDLNEHTVTVAVDVNVLSYSEVICSWLKIANETLARHSL